MEVTRHCMVTGPYSGVWGHTAGLDGEGSLQSHGRVTEWFARWWYSVDVTQYG